MIDPKEVEALIKLLDDPDQEVYQHVEGRLLSHGYDVMNYLESTWVRSLDTKLQERIINVIHKLPFHEVEKDLKEWAMGGAVDAQNGVLTVNRSEEQTSGLQSQMRSSYAGCCLEKRTRANGRKETHK